MSSHKDEADIDALVDLLDAKMRQGCGHINVLQDTDTDYPCTACQVPTLQAADEDR